MAMSMDDYYARETALKLALETEMGSTADTVLKRAQKYYEFLQGNHESATD